MMNWSALLNPIRLRTAMEGEPKSSPANYSDHRSEFQRDYDRVIFSSPVRRLQDKTQVFPLDPNDAVRTRLTHSLEVSSVARGIANKICVDPKVASDLKEHQTSVETIAATAGLVHDLGNPPFGHFGEKAIAGWFETPVGKAAIEPIEDCKELVSDFTKYEGNAQTIRLLCSLQILTDRFGLNLTLGTLSACMKYTASSAQVVPKPSPDLGAGGKKPGYLFAERPVVERIRESTGTGASRNPIAFMVEAADDCVYAFCDLEDGVKKGVVTWGEIQGLMREKAASLGQEAKEAVEQIDKIFVEVEDKITSSKINSESRDYERAQWLRILAGRQIVDGAAASFVANYDEIMKGTFRGDLLGDAHSGSAGVLVKCAKYAGHTKVYNARETLMLELRGGKVLADLLTALWPGVQHLEQDSVHGAIVSKRPEATVDARRRLWNLFSSNYRAVFKERYMQASSEAKELGVDVHHMEHYLKVLLLTDYIGGMTDSYACAMHRSLYG